MWCDRCESLVWSDPFYCCDKTPKIRRKIRIATNRNAEIIPDERISWNEFRFQVMSISRMWIHFHCEYCTMKSISTGCSWKWDFFWSDSAAGRCIAWRNAINETIINFQFLSESHRNRIYQKRSCFVYVADDESSLCIIASHLFTFVALK